MSRVVAPLVFLSRVDRYFFNLDQFLRPIGTISAASQSTQSATSTSSKQPRARGRSRSRKRDTVSSASQSGSARPVVSKRGRGRGRGVFALPVTRRADSPSLPNSIPGAYGPQCYTRHKNSVSLSVNVSNQAASSPVPPVVKRNISRQPSSTVSSSVDMVSLVNKSPNLVEHLSDTYPYSGLLLNISEVPMIVSGKIWLSHVLENNTEYVLTPATTEDSGKPRIVFGNV